MGSAMHLAATIMPLITDLRSTSTIATSELPSPFKKSFASSASCWALRSVFAYASRIGVEPGNRFPSEYKKLRYLLAHHTRGDEDEQRECNSQNTLILTDKATPAHNEGVALADDHVGRPIVVGWPCGCGVGNPSTDRAEQNIIIDAPSCRPRCTEDDTLFSDIFMQGPISLETNHAVWFEQTAEEANLQFQIGNLLEHGVTFFLVLVQAFSQGCLVLRIQ